MSHKEKRLIISTDFALVFYRESLKMAGLGSKRNGLFVLELLNDHEHMNQFLLGLTVGKFSTIQLGLRPLIPEHWQMSGTSSAIFGDT